MFDSDKQIEKMRPHVNKLVSYFNGKGITFSPDDGDLRNVVFSRGDKDVKISHHSFYRHSGIVKVYKEKDNNTFEVIEVTDSIFMENFMRPIIEKLFK